MTEKTDTGFSIVIRPPRQMEAHGCAWTHYRATSEIDHADFRVVSRAWEKMHAGECVHLMLESCTMWLTDSAFEDAVVAVARDPETEYSKPGTLHADISPPKPYGMFRGWSWCQEDDHLALHDLLVVRLWTGQGAMLIRYDRPQKGD